MLVTRKQSLKATDLDGEPVELSLVVAKKLYRCPGCRERIEVGNDHVLVRYEALYRHQHWHQACAANMARRELRGLREVAAERSQLSPGARRQAALRRRRREDRR
ncbi:MAG: hypothetical protein M3454_15680 [Actinomycetota bacterium]|nr:hypothetical protein [Actinomycetota bacterium]